MKKIAQLLLFISVFIFLFNVTGNAKKVRKSPHQLAQYHNSKGMLLYREKKYDQAAIQFKRAISYNPRHKLANYNLACMYALLLDYCEDTITINGKTFGYEILHAQLKKAVSLDPTVKRKAVKDKDFESIHNSVNFWRTLGYDLDSPNVMRKLLVELNWYSSPCIAIGCSRIVFYSDGSFIIKSVDTAIKSEPEGTYSVKKNYIHLKFRSGKRVLFDFPNKKGHLESVDGEEIIWNGAPDKCSA